MSKKISILFLTLLIFVSCDSKAVFDVYKSLPNQWSKDSEIAFTFDAPDTLNNYNLFVNLRNNNAYAFSNLYIITQLKYPNGKQIVDTLEYKMAAPDGTLLGSGFSDLKENKLWYKGHNNPFKFTETGNYTFTVKQAMRKQGSVNGIADLDGVTEVGFRIEKK